MKRPIILLPLMLALFSCATIDMNSFMVGEPTSLYSEILVLFTDAEDEFYEWNEENYQYTLMGRINSLDKARLRERLTKEMRSQLMPTRIRSVEDFFPIQKLLPYEEFMSRLEATQVEAILVVNTRGSWNTELFLDGEVYHQPNAEYHCFLIDRNGMEKVWMAKVGTYGHSLNTHSGLQNRFIQHLGKELHAKNLINKPVYGNTAMGVY
ncbi:hypothetical protein [Pararhodonellum marinum]|uniref:hypothetical protein n=1 Tax=Pararhodonellum marinum TaxID=2755358 RepID=UPI00188E5015|nr:hypothetical protein [Pararhodonellum marinum]